METGDNYICRTHNIQYLIDSNTNDTQNIWMTTLFEYTYEHENTYTIWMEHTHISYDYSNNSKKYEW